MAARHEIVMAGSRPSAQPLKPCQGRCDGELRVPEGGVQVSARKWLCASCWTSFLARSRR